MDKQPSTMMKGISALFVIVTIVAAPLTAGLLVVTLGQKK